MRHGKKAEFVLSPVMMIPIMVVVFLLTFAIFDRVLAKGTIAADEAACRMSLSLQEGTQYHIIGPVYTDSPLTTDCNKYSVTFYDDHADMRVTETGKDVSGFLDKERDYGTINQYDVNRILAELLRQCWDRVQGGVLAPGNVDTFDWGDNDLLCHICSEVYFRNTDGKVFSGLSAYLNTTTMPGSTMTYTEYLSNPDAQCDLKASNQAQYAGQTCFQAYTAKMQVNLDPVFSSDHEQGYLVYLVRRGSVKDHATMFAYVMDAADAPQQCQLYLV